MGAATRRSNSRPDELFPEQLFNTFGYHAFAPSLSGAPDPNEKKPPLACLRRGFSLPWPSLIWRVAYFGHYPTD